MSFEAAKIRNFVVAGHGSAGKTTLCDLMLYKSKAVDRPGSVDNGTSYSDFSPDEQEKHSSIYASYLNCPWRDQHFFFTDTPGYGEFVGEVISSYRASGMAVIVVDGVGGIGSGTELQSLVRESRPNLSSRGVEIPSDREFGTQSKGGPEKSGNIARRSGERLWRATGILQGRL